MPADRPLCTIAGARLRSEPHSVSYDETPTPAGPAPPGYVPAAAAPPPQSATSGWMIAFTVVLVLALGGLAAAIISKGDSGKTTATIPTVTAKTTTVQSTTTVTTQAAPANVTVAPNVTLNSSGAPEPAQTSTAAKTTGTTSAP
jgi:hypothetical protein